MWVGIGFGTEMKNSDMIIFEFYTHGQFKLSDTFFVSRKPSDDTELGGKYDLYNITSEVREDGSMVVNFTRPLNTGDQYDKVLEIVYKIIFNS